MDEELMYVCAYCGKAYDTIAERTACEITCERKAKEEAAQAREAKLAAEKAVRKKELDDLVQEFITKAQSYYQDYKELGFQHEYRSRNAFNLFDVLDLFADA